MAAAKSSKEQGFGYADVLKSMQEFSKVAGGKNNEFTSKASAKMVTSCLEKDFKKFDVKTLSDSSAFPCAKEKGKPMMLLKPESVKVYVRTLSLNMAKKKSSKVDPKGPEVKAMKQAVKKCIAGGKPDVKGTKTSATGGVGHLTDTSKYTGSHAERFDKDGKGKGKEGREDKANNSGYVGNYKEEGTYDKKH